MKAYFGVPGFAGTQVVVGLAATLVLALGAWPADGQTNSTPRDRVIRRDAKVLEPQNVVPPGFRSRDRTFFDSFGGLGYRLNDKWNFGVTDSPSNTGNRDQSQPWAWHEQPDGTSWTGAPDKLECWKPGKVTQLSTGSAAFLTTGNGLRIQARPDTAGSCPAESGKTWVSGAINTYGRAVGQKGNGTFGGAGTEIYLEARMKLPYALDATGRRISNGTMAAFWTLTGPGSTLAYPNGIDQESVCVQESGMAQPTGSNPVRTVAQTTHYPVQDASGAWRMGYQQYRKDSGTDFSAGFHTYGARVNYATQTVTYYVDGVQTSVQTNWTSKNPLILIFNLHLMGDSAGSWHSTVQKESGFSADEMNFDIAWVQVYEKRVSATV